MKLAVYDFRLAGRLDSDCELRLGDWLRSGCLTAQESWLKHLSTPVNLSLESITTAHPLELIRRIPEAGVGFQVAVGSLGSATLLVMARPLALGLVAMMFGDGVETLPEDRPLTAVETTSLEFLVQELVAAFDQAWREAGPALDLKLGETELRPQRTQCLPVEEGVIVIELGLSGGFGKQTCHWLSPRNKLENRLDGVGVEGDGKGGTARPQLEKLTGELPVEVGVELGTVELPLGQLASLRCGDLVILQQKVTDPLVARVAGRDKFRVWPGRIGSRQVIEVASLIES